MARDLAVPIARAGLVCPCLGLSEADVAAALGAGAVTVGQVFRHAGAMPRCGDCVSAVKRAVKAARNRAETPKERTTTMGQMTNGAKVKLAVMMENGDKLEYEAHFDAGADLAALKAEAERRMGEALGRFAGGAIAADRVKIETA